LPWIFILDSKPVLPVCFIVVVVVVVCHWLVLSEGSISKKCTGIHSLCVESRKWMQRIGLWCRSDCTWRIVGETNAGWWKEGATPPCHGHHNGSKALALGHFIHPIYFKRVQRLVLKGYRKEQRALLKHNRRPRGWLRRKFFGEGRSRVPLSGRRDRPSREGRDDFESILSYSPSLGQCNKA
jgi:hypothetical protein